MVRPENPDLFIQPVEMVRLRLDGADAPEPPPKPVSKVKAFILRHAVVGLMVVLPTVLAAIYLGLIAAPRYVSEAQFVVRGPSTGTDSQLTNMVQGHSDILRSGDDSYVVIAYMLSRDAMRQLISDDGLLDVFNRSEADFLWRYPRWLWGDSEEHLYRHYLKFVSVDYDDTTGISTLDVQAFRPEDAQKIANALLGHAEALVNKLNQRAEEDAIAAAQREVAESKINAFAEQDKVTAFRKQTLVLDPMLVSKGALDTIASLALNEAQTNASLAEMLKSSPENPQISDLRLRIAALEDQITKERQALAGGNNSMAPLLAEYERLSLERSFADRTFVSALAMLESARLDALRQRLYLDRISNPPISDYPAYPYRLIFIIVTFLLSGMVYRIGRAIVPDILAHAGR